MSASMPKKRRHLLVEGPPPERMPQEWERGMVMLLVGLAVWVLIMGAAFWEVLR